MFIINIENIKNAIINFWQNGNNALKCALVGAICGLAVVVIGFIETMFIILCVTIGLFIGRAKDKNIDLKDLVLEIIDKFKR